MKDTTGNEQKVWPSLKPNGLNLLDLWQYIISGLAIRRIATNNMYNNMVLYIVLEKSIYILYGDIKYEYFTYNHHSML